jgi:hypothetical protein
MTSEWSLSSAGCGGNLCHSQSDSHHGMANKSGSSLTA